MRWAAIILAISSCAEPLADEFVPERDRLPPPVRPAPVEPTVEPEFVWGGSLLVAEPTSRLPTFVPLERQERAPLASIFMQLEVFRDDVNLASVVAPPGASIHWSVDRGELLGPTDQPIVSVRSPHEDGPFTLEVKVIDPRGGQPITKRFTSTVVGRKWLKSPLTVRARREHTALTLRDGRVLLVGGGRNNISPWPTTAQLFDPLTNTFADFGETSPHRHPAVVELPDGRVLVAGDVHDARPTDIWNPETRLWTRGPVAPAGSAAMAVDQAGTVFGSFGASLYRLDSSGWTSLATRSSSPTALALFLGPGGGELISVDALAITITDLAGGNPRRVNLPFGASAATRLDDGSIVVAGDNVLGRLENGTWTTFTSPHGSQPSSLIAIEGARAVVVGVMNTVFFDGVSATRIAMHLHAWESASARLTDGSVVTFGGGAPGMSSVAAWGHLDVNSLVWQPGLLRGGDLFLPPSIMQPVSLQNGEVLLQQYALAGETPFLHFDPRNNTWSARTPPPQSTLAAVTAAFEHSFLAGQLLYDFDSDRWVSVASGFSIDAQRAVTLTSGRALLINRTEARLFDPVAMRWFVIPPPPAPLDGPSLTALPNGDAILAGGRDENGSPSLGTWTWSAATHTWNASWPLIGGAWAHQLVAFPDGRFFIGGGGTKHSPTVPQWLMPGGDLWVEQPGLETDWNFPFALSARLGNSILQVNEPDDCMCLSGRVTLVLTPETGSVARIADPAGRIGAQLTVLDDGRIMMTGGRGRAAGSVDFFKE